MDILGKRHVEITALAMDGLAARHKAITSNIANANSPNYKAINVSFEDQLQRIIDTEERKQQHKKDNSQGYEASKTDMGFEDFMPETLMSRAQSSGANNVNIEREMAELAKNGMKYNALAMLQQKAFQGMKDVIQKGGS